MYLRFAILLLLSCALAPVVAQEKKAPASPFRIAVLACHRQFEPTPALVHYAEAQPDLCLWIGDNVYADAPEDPAFIQQCYDAMAAKPEFQMLMKNRDFMATWDDHDYGLNDAGKEYKFKEQSKAMFRKFWNLDSIIPADRDGIYYSRFFEVSGKKLQVIMLDVRYNRDAQGSNGDVLGEKQWLWLEAQLQEPADLRLVVSGFQVLLHREAGSETWDKFPAARDRLFQTIRRARAERVVLLTGDQHYGEVSRMPAGLDYDAVELQFAGINQIEGAEFNPYRVTPVTHSRHSMALIDIFPDSSRSDVPHLVFHITDVMQNKNEFSYRLNFSELDLHVNFSGATRFADNGRIEMAHSYPSLDLRYTVDGSIPGPNSPVYTAPVVVKKNTVVKACLFTKDKTPRSRVFERSYQKLTPMPAAVPKAPLEMGLAYSCYIGNYEVLPDFSALTPAKTGIATNTFDLKQLAGQDDHFALAFEGFFTAGEKGIYEFFTLSDDGSRLYVDGVLVVDNDGSHSARKRTGLVALEKGLHALRIEYFDDYSGEKLSIGFLSPEGKMETLAPNMLFHQRKK